MPLRPRHRATIEERLAIHRGAWFRAAGNSVCATCGRLYYDHPQLEAPNEWLNRTCDGDLVKL